MDRQEDFKKDTFIIFRRLASESFDFLEKSYRFELSSARYCDECMGLFYTSKRVFVNVLYGPPGYEIYFSFGRRGIDDRPDQKSFNSGDLSYLHEVDEKWVFPAYSYDSLRKYLPKLAELLKKYGKACLVGESSVYERMLVEREEHLRRSHRKQELAHARTAARTAWKMKKYAEVVRLFEPFLEELTKSERKKIEYCRNRT